MQNLLQISVPILLNLNLLLFIYKKFKKRVHNSEEQLIQLFDHEVDELSKSSIPKKKVKIESVLEKQMVVVKKDHNLPTKEDKISLLRKEEIKRQLNYSQQLAEIPEVSLSPIVKSQQAQDTQEYSFSEDIIQRKRKVSRVFSNEEIEKNVRKPKYDFDKSEEKVDGEEEDKPPQLSLFQNIKTPEEPEDHQSFIVDNLKSKPLKISIFGQLNQSQPNGSPSQKYMYNEANNNQIPSIINLSQNDEEKKQQSDNKGFFSFLNNTIMQNQSQPDSLTKQQLTDSQQQQSQQQQEQQQQQNQLQSQNQPQQFEILKNKNNMFSNLVVQDLTKTNNFTLGLNTSKDEDKPNTLAGLFSNTQQQPSQGLGLFANVGKQEDKQQQPLFGNLFGQQSQQQNSQPQQQQQQQQQQPQQQQQQQGFGLFGGFNLNQLQQPKQQDQPANSLFGNFLNKM